MCVCACVVLPLNYNFILPEKAGENASPERAQRPLCGHWPKSHWGGVSQPLTSTSGPCRRSWGGYFQIICSYHQTSGYASIRKKGHFRPWDLSAGFPKPCLSLLFPNAQRLLMPQDIILWWIPSPRLGLMPSCQAHKHSIPRVWSTFMRGNQGTAKHSWDTHNSPCLWSCK